MSNELTRVTLRVVPALLVVALLTVGCGTTPAIEQPGSVVVAATEAPTPLPPSGTSEAAEPAATEASRATPDASDAMPTPIPGAQMAPDFSLPDVDGQTWTLSQFRGRPVMLFVWATW